MVPKVRPEICQAKLWFLQMSFVDRAWMVTRRIQVSVKAVKKLKFGEKNISRFVKTFLCLEVAYVFLWGKYDHS